LGIETKVNLFSGNFDDSRPDIAMDASGNFTIVYHTNNGSGYDIYARQYAADGTQLGVNPFALQMANADQTYPAIAMRPNGEFVVAWNDFSAGNYDVQARRFNANGTANGAAFTVANGAGEQSFPAIANDGSSRYFITFNAPDANLLGVYGRYYDAATNTFNAATPFLISTNNQTNYQTASRVAFNASGDAVVTWVDSSGLDGSGLGIYARRYSALGVAAAPFIVSLST